MSKLYPPVIEETLPAFYSENGIVKFTIPFSMNRAVSSAEIAGFELKIKTVQSGTTLYTVESYSPNNFSLNTNNLYVSFSIKDDQQKFKLGQFYKLQLAYVYVDGDTKNNFLNQYYSGSISMEEYEAALSARKKVGYYSGASVAKYTSKPKLYIANLNPGFLNSFSNSYVGCYEQISTENEKKDSTEKVYYYKFDVYDNSGINLFYSSDYKLHNTSLDSNIDFSEDKFDLNQDIEYNSIYYVQYSIITTNGLQISTPKYKVVHRELIDAQIDVNIDASCNLEEGYMDIRLIGKKNEQGVYDIVTGAFLLLRSDEDSEYKHWVEMNRFTMNGEIPSDKKIIFRDFTFVQGKKYQYALQQYSDRGLYSNKVYSDIVQADFEYGFLYDGKRQLKIKYNSKTTKLTNTRLEQKIDTIGSKYPFIFRNGQVNYHEFPVGGLISYFTDEEHLFMSEEEFLVVDKTTNYTTDNIVNERTFRTKVLEWLNNGEVKIFKSPTEGNFIIRLLKVSMTPEAKLGNLLYNFNATAYEIAEYNYSNLCAYGFITPEDKNDQVLNFATINLNTIDVGTNINRNKEIIQTVQCEDMTPGEELLITFQDETQETIIIGATGKYYINNSKPIKAISVVPKYQPVKVRHDYEFKNNLYYVYEKDKYVLPTGEKGMHPFVQYFKIANRYLSGQITYSYFTNKEYNFGLIENVSMDDCSIQQFIGEHDILQEIRDFKYQFLNKENVLLTKYIKHPKFTIMDYYSMVVRPRPIEYCDVITFTEDGIPLEAMLYHKINGDMITPDNVILFNNAHPFTLYYDEKSAEFIKFHGSEYDTNLEYYTYDGINGYLPYSLDTHFEEYIYGGVLYYKNKYKLFDNTIQKYTSSDYSPYITINGNQIYITKDTEFDLSLYDDITELKCGNGVVVEIVYQRKIIDYTIESVDPVFTKKQEYLTTKTNYNAGETSYDKLVLAYNQYITTLIEELNKEGVITLSTDAEKEGATS